MILEQQYLIHDLREYHLRVVIDNVEHKVRIEDPFSGHHVTIGAKGALDLVRVIAEYVGEWRLDT